MEEFTVPDAVASEWWWRAGCQRRGLPAAMKVQPIYGKGVAAGRIDVAVKPPGKSRLKRLFERQFPGVLWVSSADKLGSGDGKEKEKDDSIGGIGDVEPSSMCLDKMVISFMEGSHTNEKPPRGSCNCFNGKYEDSSDDDLEVRDLTDGPSVTALAREASELVKGLVLCVTVAERNLLADASKLVAEKAKNWKCGDDCRKLVVDGLRSVGYDAAVCRSRWYKTPTFPAGVYHYIDVILAGGDRVIVDVVFKSQFEVARSTKAYQTVLQQLPELFVGSPERLHRIVAVVSEAARQSLRKKGLHVPPWRMPDYMHAKWLSAHQRTTAMADAKEELVSSGQVTSIVGGDSSPSSNTSPAASPVALPCSGDVEESSGDVAKKFVSSSVVVWPRRSPATTPKASEKIVAGLAAVL